MTGIVDHELVRPILSMVLDTLRACLFIGFVTVLIVVPVLILVDLGRDEPFIRRNRAEAPPYPDREGQAHPCEAPGSPVFPLC